MLTETAQLITELRRRRWTQYRWGPPHQLVLVAWTYIHNPPDFADVILLRGEDAAIGYRKPLLPNAGPWSPDVVMYQYHSGVVRTLRAMLALPRPGQAGAPTHLEVPAAGCALPPDLPSPTVINPLGVR
jgi:hypothetical protein